MSNKRLAKKGRYGDTKIRKVDGRKSHVNKREAEMIDAYGLLGEMLVKAIGSGTINPKTGLPEYDWKKSFGKVKQDKNSPHNRAHSLFQSSGGKEGKDSDHKTPEALIAEQKTEEGTVGSDYGLESLGKDQFYDENGKLLPLATVVDNVLKHKQMPEGYPEGMPAWRKNIQDQVRDFLPKMEKFDPEGKEMEFLGKDKTAAEKKADIYGEEADLAKEKAGNVYELGISAAGREEAGLKEQYGLGVSAAGRARGAAGDVYGAAGDVYGAAQESYGLGQSAAKRGLQGTLGQLQQQAGQLGAGMRSAYGGMGGGMRGAMGAQATMKKGVEQTYGVFTDKQTALEGALGRAESAYGRAGSAAQRAEGAYGDEMTRLGGVQERGLGAVADERTRLGQEKGYAGTAFGIAGQKEEGMRTAAQLAYDKGEYGLEKGAEADWETNVGSWMQGIGSDYMKQGGRVPSKQTFTEMLSRIPDAGGS